MLHSRDAMWSPTQLKIRDLSEPENATEQ